MHDLSHLGATSAPPRQAAALAICCATLARSLGSAPSA
jgi:hypothetical protein